MKKNILICANTLEYGGIEKSLVTLLNNINYNKYNIDLVLEKKQGDLIKDINKNVNILEVKVSTNKIKILRKIINYTRKLLFNIKHNNYDASVCYATYSYSANKLARISSNNKILFIHSDYTLLYNDKELKNFYDTRYINEFNKIVFVSNEMKNNLIKIYPNIKNKSYVINNLIDYENILKLSKENVDIKFNKDNINLLFVGRLDETSKNIMLQLELINKLKNKYKNIRLYIIGDGIDKDKYINYIKENKLEKFIKLLGYIKNPYPYIKECNYIILTSFYEGFPVIFNEALVLKKCVLSTLKLSDDIINIGDNFGILISNKIDTLTREIEEIIKNKKENIININIEQINKKRIKKIEELLDKE